MIPPLFKKLTALFLVIGLFAGGPDVAMAQVQPDPILEIERGADRTRRTNALQGFAGDGRQTGRGPGPISVEGPCFDLTEIIISDATILSEDQIAAIVAPYVPGCVSGGMIQAIMDRIDRTYANAGFITSRSFIPPQNIADGTLDLVVVEGFVERIVMTDGKTLRDDARAKRQIAMAFPGLEGEIFQLRQVEQGLDQMKRLPSVAATVQLEPGQEIGGSLVVIERLQSDRTRGWLRLDNLGSAHTGKNTLAIETEYDDVLGLNDMWSFTLKSTRDTNALSATGSIPWGRWSFSGSAGYSEYLTPLTDFSELFGSNNSARLSARWLMNRDQDSKTELTFALSARDGARYVNDAALTPQSLRSFAIGVEHLQLGAAARNSFDATLTIGLDFWGADSDPAGLSRRLPHAQFVKLSGGWQRQSTIEGLGAWISDLRAQIAPQALYGTEHIAIGSTNSVRGYEATVGSGENGIYLRNDLYLRDDVLPGGLSRFVQVNLFLDVGAVRDLATRKSYVAAGAGAGIGFGYGRVTGTATLGIPLVENNNLSIGKPVFGIDVNVKTW